LSSCSFSAKSSSSTFNQSPCSFIPVCRQHKQIGFEQTTKKLRFNRISGG
jgi:hypothetical protein